MAKIRIDLAKSTIPAPRAAGARFLFAQRGTAAAGLGVASHSHPFCQLEVVVSGRVLAVAGESELALERGAALFIPARVPHRFAYLEPGAAWVSWKFVLDGPGPQEATLLDRGAQLQALRTALDRLLPASGSPAAAACLAIGHLLAAIAALADPQEDGRRALPPFAERVRRLVEAGEGRAWTVAGLAAELGCSPGHCSARFRAEAGEPLKPFLDRCRAACASRLLAYSDLEIGAIAGLVDFPDLFAFSRFFARVTGRSPRAYRRSRR